MKKHRPLQSIEATKLVAIVGGLNTEPLPQLKQPVGVEPQPVPLKQQRL